MYGYASEHYPDWRKQLPNMELPWGVFGENLTTEGVSEGGDRAHGVNTPCWDLVRLANEARYRRPREPARGP